MNRCIMMLLILSTTQWGCLSRAIREGAGVATGASGYIVELVPATDLTEYRGYKIGDLEPSHGLRVPSGMAGMLRRSLSKAAEELQLEPDARPALRISGEIVHYESSDAIDDVIGPLSEVILRALLSDASSHRPVGQANLVGRSMAITTSGAENLADGVGRALKDWFEDHGLEEPEPSTEE